MPKKRAGKASGQENPVEKAVSHPLRMKIIVKLAGNGECTQTEVAKEVDAATASVRHHLRVLERAGLVSLTGTRPGPKGITEKLFSINRDKMEIVKKGSKEAKNVGMFRHISEAIRVGQRMLAKDEGAAEGGFLHEVEASPDDLLKLLQSWRRALDRLDEAQVKSPKGAKHEANHYTVCAFVCPANPPRKRGKKKPVENLSVVVD